MPTKRRWTPEPQKKIDRRNCRNRHENGNCLSVGGFCTSVPDEYCKYQPKVYARFAPNDEAKDSTDFE